MPIDPNVFNNIKNFPDYQRADQEFQLKRALAAQQLQSGGIDAASKANVYKTQLLSGAAAGGQQAYDQARQTLQQQGIDTSEYASDVETAGKQLQSARLSQSPLGSLINAGLKMDSNDIQRAGVTGVLPNGSNVPVIIGGNLPSVQAPTQNSQPTLPPAPPVPPVPPANAPLPAQIFGGNNGSELPQPSPGVPVISPGTSSRFSPPQQNPNETLPAYNARVEQAFKAYNSDPNVIATQEGAKTIATNRAKEGVEREANYTKAQSALQGFGQQTNIVTDTVDKALATVSPLSTGYGSLLSGLPNTDARKLNNYLNTIKANVGFDKLQNMRDNSPTGGALGQVSDMENKLLQAVNGALDPGQSDQLVENLKNIKVLYPQVLAEKQRAFNQDYGAFKPLGGNLQAPPATPANNTAVQPNISSSDAINELRRRGKL